MEEYEGDKEDNQDAEGYVSEGDIEGLEEYEGDEENNQDAEGYVSEGDIVSYIDEMDVVDNGPILHFVDSIVEGDEKADSSVTLSYVEAYFHILRQHFLYVRKVNASCVSVVSKPSGDRVMEYVSL